MSVEHLSAMQNYDISILLLITKDVATVFQLSCSHQLPNQLTSFY